MSGPFNLSFLISDAFHLLLISGSLTFLVFWTLAPFVHLGSLKFQRVESRALWGKYRELAEGLAIPTPFSILAVGQFQRIGEESYFCAAPDPAH